MRPIRLLTLALPILLAACASAPPKRVNPPTVSIQKLSLARNAGFEIELRLQNHSDVTMTFAEIDLLLRIADIDAGNLAAQRKVEVSPHNAEIVRINLAADSAASEPLKGAEAANSDETASDAVLEGEFEYENQNGELVKVPINPARREEIEKSLADQSDTAVRYQLRGTVRISDPTRDYDIDFESRLSPVPGKPGEFR